MTTAWILLLLWAAVVAAADGYLRRLPNWLTLGAFGMGLLILLATGRGALDQSTGACLAGAAAAVLLTLPGYALNWLGAGDVKLLAAIGMLGGFQIMITTFVVSSFLAAGAGLLVLGRVALRHTTVDPGQAGPSWGISPTRAVDGARLPFGAFAALGLIAALLVLP